MSTGFADPTERYIHIMCQAEGRALCGEWQVEDPVWLEEHCSPCLLVAEMQHNVCPFGEGVKCSCFA
jgi:hypothetical protein